MSAERERPGKAIEAENPSLAEMRARLGALPNPGRLLEAIFACAPVGLQIYARDGRCVLVNARHTELFGGVPPPDYNVFEDTVLIERGVSELVRRAFAGERISIPPIWYDIRDLRNISITTGGRRFAVSAELVPLTSAGATEVEHVLFVFHDVTEAHEAREQAELAAASAVQARQVAEEAARHAEFLAEAGRVLSSSLDYEATLGALARLATPTLADFCIVDVFTEDGSLRRVGAAHADLEKQPLLDELCRKFPPRAGSPQPAMRAIASRRPDLLAEIDPEVIAGHTTSEEHRALMTALGVRSHLTVPILLRERILGAIGFGYVGTRRYRPSDIPVVEALATRAALAIDNARLYQDAQLARAQAEAANRAKDEFLAMLGHELRNPLAPIVTALELTRTREGPSRERAVIERQVQHMRRLVDDLLDVARITRGKLELNLRPMELYDIIREGVELAQPLIDERGHHLVLECPARGLLVNGDPVRLAQVVANLLSNAARYSAPHGTIRLTGTRRGDEVVLTVRDTGMGISPELLPHVFDMFAQGQQSADRSAGGLGLGLAIVKSLVELHGGKVVARSEGPGRGSEFEVLFPAHAGAPAVPASAPQPEPSTQAPRVRVLVVDDNEDAADLLAELLSSQGCETFVAHHPHAALKLAREHVPQVALLDIGLPDMDGYELAQRLRSDPALAGMHLVAVTGYGQASDRARSREAGFREHLVKPVNLELLLQIIRQLTQA